VGQASSLYSGQSLSAGYRLRRPLGRGGFGEVWEAQARDGRPVAVKFMACGSASAAQELRSTLAICRLPHPNLVQIEDVWYEHGHLALAMELGEGSLLDLGEISRLELGGPLPADLVCGYLTQAAAALDFLNARTHRLERRVVGIQHGDVKPSNLLLFGEVVKLCDFGLATATGSPAVRHRRNGTPCYAAPEVFRGFLSDQTDQFALAVTYCELRGGRLPFNNAPKEFDPNYVHPAADLSMVGEPERPIVARALAPAAPDRWSSCGSFLRRLARVVPMRAGAPPERRLEVRHTCPHRPALRVTTGTGETLTVVLANVSRSGIGLLVDRPLDEGTEVVVLAPGAGFQEPRRVPARVVRRGDRPEGGWSAGCRLAVPLSDEELTVFLRTRPLLATSGV
jgi:serine/threonine protein kinase